MSLNESQSSQENEQAVDLSKLLDLAATVGTVSPPVVVKELKVTFPQAAEALQELAQRHFLEMLPESGLVPTYRVTRAGYVTLETGRMKRGKLFGSLFQH